MKKLLSILLLSSVLIACSKDGDDEEEDFGPASFIVRNETSTDLENVVAGSIKSGTGKLIKNFGTIAKNVTTDIAKVEDRTVAGVYLFFDIGSKTYMLTNQWPISFPDGGMYGTITEIVVTNGSSSEEISKTDARYPK